MPIDSQGPHCLVVGAGPAGAALALLLARNGVRVTLVEREADQHRVFRGEGLMPSGLNVLQQMGLGPTLAELPGEPFEAWHICVDRTEVMQIPEPRDELGPLAPRIVSQPALLQALLSRAGEFECFELRDGTTVRDLLREDGRVVGVRVAGKSGESEIRADFVIGADGRSSTIRKRAGVNLDLQSEAYDVIWFKVPPPPELGERTPIHIFASGPDAALAYVSWDRRWQIAWMQPKGSWREVRDHDWLSDCAELMPDGFAAHLRGQREHLDGPSVLDVIVGRCPTWHRPGLLLLGDAAHPMSPVRAQGINMALRDAVVAANHIVRAATGEGNLDDASRAIQGERDPEIIRAQRLQFQEVRGQRWARAQPWLMRTLLRLAVPWLTATEGRRRWIAKTWLRQQAPLRMGITDVQLRV